jgi:hypothetical protein
VATASRPALDLFVGGDVDEDFDEDLDEDVVLSVESLFELDKDFDEDVIVEAESLVDVDELDGSAYAMPDAVAMPTPRATANAPTRPICLA